jgi:hypothetical protein
MVFYMITKYVDNSMYCFSMTNNFFSTFVRAKADSGLFEQN